VGRPSASPFFATTLGAARIRARCIQLRTTAHKQDSRLAITGDDGLTDAQVDSDAVYPQLVLGKSALQGLMADMF
jgi:hypothetical protein